ncbi:MAG: deoxyribonuclease V [Candidatus Brocadiae bacterium]|nr:deoxyribonuclease V [Candidatus Brocadiia bacterium]
MIIRDLHRWDLTPAEARRLQERLAGRVRLAPLPRRMRWVAGADMALDRAAGACFASVVVLELPEMKLVEEVAVQGALRFPYIPGLLSFREGPVLLKAFARIEHVPDVVIFDGQGLAHPRRLGLASHMGLWLGIPTVGCAKSRLTGKHDEPGQEKGRSVPLLDDGEQIGVVLRTRTRVKPVFVSPGHLTDFETSARLVLDCCTKYRLPEPTRLADIAVARAKRDTLPPPA